MGTCRTASLSNALWSPTSPVPPIEYLLDDFSADYVSCFVFFFHVKLIISSIYFLSCGFIPFYCFIIVVVQLLSCVQLFVTTRIAAHQVSLSFTISRSLLKLMSTELVMPSNPSSSVVPFCCLQSFLASGSASRSFSRTLAAGIFTITLSCYVAQLCNCVGQNH